MTQHLDQVTTDREKKAIDCMPDLLRMVKIDAMKLTHYLEDAVKVSIVAKDDVKKIKLASLYIDMQNISDRLELL